MQRKIMRFTVVFEKAEEGGYIVSVPALPGCMTQGDTFEEAEKMVKDAINCYCQSLRKHGKKISLPKADYIGVVTVPVSV